MSGAHPAVPGDPVVLDGGDRRCVLLLIELRRLVADLEPGRVVHLIASDPAAPIDLPAWCHLTGHTYLGPVQTGTLPPASAAYAVRVEAESRPTRAQAPWQVADS
ncbi:sulfurtransferase tusA [Spongiactinospora gelatinilytica]|uniref:Sulfurtransferase tusA n=1 Tax=Spongiactinospora gelatinilytica TaxID=2666298 RepID=A0A2W2H4X5_9ACTN|nr:sulfurtransferase TusA family protein [Spongiactinospora gelatinilytica]PZG55671.1 sulfurtransferase tusA [Spongiactinospora gelatinilytica]